MNACWLGREDSNLRIQAPKARALPLGDAPTFEKTLNPALYAKFPKHIHSIKRFCNYQFDLFSENKPEDKITEPIE